MPYKSDAQRRWAHTDSAKKADFPTDEFDKASKGQKLPEKAPKMDMGGITDQTPTEMDTLTEGLSDKPSVKDQYWANVGTGISHGINDQLDSVTSYLKGLYSDNKDKIMNGNPDISPTLPGLQNLANQAAGEPQQMSEGGISFPHREKSGPDLTKRPQAFAEGGVVDDGADFLSKLNAGTAMTPQQPQFNPQAGLPPPPPTPPIAMPQDNGIGAYLSQQKQQMGQYGPEQQMAVSKNILGQQNSLGGRLTNAGAGLGDAIMGVAGKQSPGFQANLHNRQNNQANMQMEALKGARGANTENLQMGQKLDAMDPNSALSKAKQQANGPILGAMGFDPKTVSKMSASEMDTAMTLLKDFRGKDLEVAVARYKAQIEANALKETTRSHRAEEGIKGEEIHTGELEKAAAVPFTSRVAQMFGMNPAGEKLQQEAVPGNNTMTPDVLTYAAKHQITPQAALAIKNKRLGVQ